jgi:hypothetical protein
MSSLRQLTAILAITLAGPSLAADNDWRTLSFAGREYRADANGALAVRDGYLPFRRYSGLVLRENRLPAGTGALAGICFVQVSGGRLGSAAGSLPLSGEAIEVSGKRLSLAVRTDRDGYFVLALPPAAYELRWRGFAQKVTVSNGTTTLVALRGGKRLVD